MKTKVAILATMFVLLSVCNVFAVPNLRLPFQGGEKWRCDQGNSTDPSNFVNGKETNQTHLSTNSMSYAWDFNFGSGDDDSGKPVVAPASGTIVYAKNSDSDWGNVVIINYGDDIYGKVAHLERIDVNKGDSVAQGQQIGTCGGTPGHTQFNQ